MLSILFLTVQYSVSTAFGINPVNLLNLGSLLKDKNCDESLLTVWHEQAD